MGLAYAAQNDVFHGGESDFGTEEMRDVIGVGMDGFGDVGEFDVLFIVSIDIFAGQGGWRGPWDFFGRAVLLDELTNLGK